MGGGVLHSKVIGRFLDLFLSRNLPHDLPWETHFEFIVHFLFFLNLFPPQSTVSSEQLWTAVSQSGNTSRNGLLLLHGFSFNASVTSSFIDWSRLKSTVTCRRRCIGILDEKAILSS